MAEDVRKRDELAWWWTGINLKFKVDFEIECELKI